ncbi:MAG: pirin family protein, partial [Spirochaetes bacterium]|nr:pirin family protein [Spirochaetota bacterium]
VTVFTLTGDAVVGKDYISEKTAVKLSDGDNVIIKSAGSPCQVLWICSKRLDEPVAWGGPIVMNTREELAKAFDDLDKGTFLKDKINY